MESPKSFFGNLRFRNYLSHKKKFLFAILRPMFTQRGYILYFLPTKLVQHFVERPLSERGANLLSRAFNYECKFLWLEAQDLKLCHSIARNVTDGRQPIKLFRALI